MKTARKWPSTASTLLGRLRDPRDELAWRRFVDVYWPLIVHFAGRHGLQNADAENAAQEVLTRVARAIRGFQYDPGRGRFRNWLGLIVRQQIARHHASRSVESRAMRERGVEPFEDQLAREVDGEWVEAFNAHIYRCARDATRLEFDEGTWRAFELVWELGVEPREAAIQLGRAADWVYQAKFRVLHRVKQEVMRLCSDTAIFGRPR